jgi:hypothetical protein
MVVTVLLLVVVVVVVSDDAGLDSIVMNDAINCGVDVSHGERL